MNSVNRFLFIQAKKSLVLLSIIFVVSACATLAPTPFVQADSYGDIGFADKKLSDDQYQIIFTGNAKTDIQKAKDYALLHAANLTLEKGYTWFEIITSDADQETKTVTRVEPSPVVVTDTTKTCGILGCTITNATTYQGRQTSTQVVDDNVIATLLIKMGRSNPENPNRVFDANALRKNLSDIL